MPRAPLQNPTAIWPRVRGNTIAVLVAIFGMLSLLFFNGLQVLSMLFLPFSRRLVRRINRFLANTWWGLATLFPRWVYGTRIVVTGDEVPVEENAIVAPNHQQMADVTFLFFFALSKRRLGDLKWFLKDVIKYVPGVGWGLYLLDSFCVKRSWSTDRESIARTFARITRDRIPFWVMIFPEGTRMKPSRYEQAVQFAKSRDLPVPENVLIPRTAGVRASVQGLREQLDALYDVTIGYESGAPSLWQYMCGYCRVAHLHVRRFAVGDLPHTDEEIDAWILERFRVKDELLARFHRTGSFDDPARSGAPSDLTN